MQNALVLLADGFEDIEAITVIDVLRRGGVAVTTASIHDRLEVKSAHNVMMKADALYTDVADAEPYGVIVLPGGGEGTENLKAFSPLKSLLLRQREEGRLIAAICAAPTALVAADVIEKGVHMTCYPTCQMELDRPWGNASVVEDRGLITGQAPGSAMLFSLVILKALVGETIALKIARGMVTDVLQ
jgi:4-methyl-5(b-hydroxyethyl)-thiazole monophosphate biosynthesis